LNGIGLLLQAITVHHAQGKGADTVHLADRQQGQE
jgi:hypothetical protein